MTQTLELGDEAPGVALGVAALVVVATEVAVGLMGNVPEPYAAASWRVTV